MDEIWKDIPGYDLYYEISNLGRIRSKPQIMKTFSTGRNRSHVALALRDNNSKKKTHLVHVLVAETFIGPRPGGDWRKIQVNHIDGNSKNNCVSNLEYVTCAENHRHAVRLGLAYIGEKNGNAKLTAEDVRDIRTMTAREASKKYGVHYQTARNIINRKKWKHVT